MGRQFCHIDYLVNRGRKVSQFQYLTSHIAEHLFFVARGERTDFPGPAYALLHIYHKAKSSLEETNNEQRRMHCVQLFHNYV